MVGWQASSDPVADGVIMRGQSRCVCEQHRLNRVESRKASNGKSEHAPEQPVLIISQVMQKI